MFISLTRRLVVSTIAFLTFAGAASAETDNFKTFQDPNFGFSFQLPESWQFYVNENRDYVFLGADNTPASQGTIILQVLTKAGNEGSTDASLLRSFWASLQSVPGAGVEGEGMVPLAGGESPYFIAHYQVGTDSGQSAEFKHIQVILDHGDYFYPLSFSAPTPIYEEYLKVFQHMVSTFSFGG